MLLGLSLRGVAPSELPHLRGKPKVQGFPSDELKRNLQSQAILETI